jgi:hypothetical protein
VRRSIVAFPRIHLRTKSLCRVTFHGLPAWLPVAGKGSHRVIFWFISTLRSLSLKFGVWLSRQGVPCMPAAPDTKHRDRVTAWGARA